VTNADLGDLITITGALAALGILAVSALALPRLADLIYRAEASYDCDCGHEPDTHEHYRPGTDCGACGPQECPSYRAARPALVPVFPGGGRR
jgi:hypothetical protein